MAGFYLGKICDKHPLLDGKRRRASGECCGCVADRNRRRRANESPEARSARLDRERKARREWYARLSPEARAKFNERHVKYRVARRDLSPSDLHALRAKQRADAARRRLTAPEGKQRRLARARLNGEFGFLRYDKIKWRGLLADRPTREQLQDLWVRQNNRCGLTGLSLEGATPHLDHKVPLAKGGTDRIDNLHWTHPIANYAKGTASVEEFRVWLLSAADALRAKIAIESLL